MDNIEIHCYPFYYLLESWITLDFNVTYFKPNFFNDNIKNSVIIEVLLYISIIMDIYLTIAVYSSLFLILHLKTCKSLYSIFTITSVTNPSFQ